MKFILSILIVCIAYTSYSQEGNQCKEDLFPYFDKEKRMWGYSNVMDQMVIEPIFTKVSPFYSSRAIVQKGKYCGVIDCEGNLVIPVQFDKIQNFKNNKTWVQKNNLWGVYDANGKELLKPQYIEVLSINHTEFSWVRKDSLWGLFNEEKGTMLCDAQYSKAVPMSTVCSLIEQKGKLGVLNHVNCSSLIQFNIDHVKKINARDILFEQSNKWGMFNSEGKVIIEPKFDSLIQVKEGLLAGKLNNAWGMIALSGKTILPFEFEAIYNYSNGFFRIKKSNQFGYAAINGKIYIQPNYEEASDFINKKAIVKSNGKYGIINLSNQYIITPSYKSIQLSNSGNYAIVKNEENSKLDMIIFYKDSVYKYTSMDSIQSKDNDQAVRTYKNGQLTYFDVLNNQPLFKNQYLLDGGPLTEGVLIVKNNQGKFILSLDGTTITKNYYDEIIRTTFGKYTLYIVIKQQKKGLLDNQGNVMYETQYDDVVLYTPTYIALLKDKEWFLYKLNGKPVNSIAFTSIGQAWNGRDLIMARKNKWGLLKIDGTETLMYKGIALEYTDGFSYILRNKSFAQLMDENGNLDKTKFRDIRYSSLGIEIKNKNNIWIVK